MRKITLLFLAVFYLLACGTENNTEAKNDTTPLANINQTQAPEKEISYSKQASNPNDWQGEYVYDESLGEGIFYVYSLKFYQEEGVLMATFNIDGYQSMSRFIAKVVVKNEFEADLVFEKYGDDDLFKNRYQKGELIMPLKKVDEKNIEAMLEDATLTKKKVVFKATEE